MVLSVPQMKDPHPRQTPANGARHIIHITPLSNCGAFRVKSIEERKRLLNQHSICFRCIASTAHREKDCVAEVKSGTAAQTKEPAEPQRQSEEASNATISCTDVCGYVAGNKSCSKTCLSNIYVTNRPSPHIVNCRMKVDAFGNTSSRAVATFGLHTTAQVKWRARIWS